MVEHLDDLGLWLAAVVGGLTAVGWLLRKAFVGARWAVRLARLLDYQLRNNGGGSLLDKVERQGRDLEHLTGTVTEVAGTVDTLTQRFDEHLATKAEADRAMWPAVQAVAEARPPRQ